MAKWQKETFGEATAQSKLHHLNEEIKELHHALGNNDPEASGLEYADCFILLYGSAAARGMSYEDICKAIRVKMDINKSRKWGKPDSLGIVNHIID